MLASQRILIHKHYSDGVGVASRERIHDHTCPGVWSYLNNTPLLDLFHIPLGPLWEGEGSKGTFPTVDDSL